MRFSTSSRCLLRANAIKPKKTLISLQTRLESTKAPNTEHVNPGNFANRSKEEVRAIGSKGGKASSSGSGGFANMDPDVQVCLRQPVRSLATRFRR
jgi:general stress protein YciG